jgi:hypothetical protein
VLLHRRIQAGRIPIPGNTWNQASHQTHAGRVAIGNAAQHRLGVRMTVVDPETTTTGQPSRGGWTRMPDLPASTAIHAHCTLLLWNCFFNYSTSGCGPRIERSVDQQLKAILEKEYCRDSGQDQAADELIGSYGRKTQRMQTSGLRVWIALRQRGFAGLAGKLEALRPLQRTQWKQVFGEAPGYARTCI